MTTIRASEGRRGLPSLLDPGLARIESRARRQTAPPRYERRQLPSAYGPAPATGPALGRARLTLAFLSLFRRILPDRTGALVTHRALAAAATASRIPAPSRRRRARPLAFLVCAELATTTGSSASSRRRRAHRSMPRLARFLCSGGLRPAGALLLLGADGSSSRSASAADGRRRFRRRPPSADRSRRAANCSPARFCLALAPPFVTLGGKPPTRLTTMRVQAPLTRPSLADNDSAHNTQPRRASFTFSVHTRPTRLSQGARRRPSRAFAPFPAARLAPAPPPGRFPQLFAWLARPLRHTHFFLELPSTAPGPTPDLRGISRSCPFTRA